MTLMCFASIGLLSLCPSLKHKILLKSIFLDCIKNRSEISGCILGKNEMEPPFEHKETFGVVDELCLLKRDCFGDDPYQNTGSHQYCYDL